MVCSGACTLHSCETWPCSYGDQDLGEPRMVAADEDEYAREVTQMGGDDRQPLTTTVANDAHGRHGAGGETKRADPTVVTWQ